MIEEPTNARKSFGDLAPHLADITDIWASTKLSPRDRSLVTITRSLVSQRVNAMPFHFRKALENGVTNDEIIAAITHLAFFVGRPPAMTALQIERKVFA